MNRLEIDKSKLSPMMIQYLDIKKNYEDAILFFRIGDFYEMFFEDANLASRELELTLTGKNCGLDERVPMCGIPHHAIDSYIARLVEKGYKVAICEQLEDPSKAKGIVKRDVIKVITPGTQVEGSFIEDKKNNYIMSIYKEGMFFGIAVCDISTGDFYSTEIKEDNNFSKLLDEISRFNPSEIIINKMMYESNEEIKTIKSRFDAYITYEKDEKSDRNISDPLDAEKLKQEDILKNTNSLNEKDEDEKIANVNKDAYAVISDKKMHWNKKMQNNFKNN